MTTLARARSLALTPGVLAFAGSSRIRTRPATIFRALQRLDPVHQSPLGLVILSGHADVAAALRNPALGSDEASLDPASLRIGAVGRWLGSPDEPEDGSGDFLDLVSSLLIFRDPPDHTRLRSLVAKAFTPRRVEVLVPRMQEIVDELLDPLLARGEVELMGDLAYPFPARVICDLLGLPAEGREVFVRHAPALALGLDPAPMRTVEGMRRADVATRELRAYLRSAIAERRSRPADDLLSALIQAESEGSRLTEDEMIAVVLLLVLAGHETTANVLGSAVHRMLGDAALRDWFRHADDDGLRTGVEEVLRLDGPVRMVQRITTEATEVGGLALPAGRMVVPFLAAANRDPAAFVDARCCHPERVENPHVSFGAGPHFCIGASLARAELRVALRTLARRLPPSTRLASPPRRRRSFTLSGLETLPMRW